MRVSPSLSGPELQNQTQLAICFKLAQTVSAIAFAIIPRCVEVSATETACVGVCTGETRQMGPT